MSCLDVRPLTKSCIPSNVGPNSFGRRSVDQSQAGSRRQSNLHANDPCEFDPQMLVIAIRDACCDVVCQDRTFSTKPLSFCRRPINRRFLSTRADVFHTRNTVLRLAAISRRPTKDSQAHFPDVGAQSHLSDFGRTSTLTPTCPTPPLGSPT